MSVVTTYRDLTKLTSVLKVSLGVYMALAAIGIWSGWIELELLQRLADGSDYTQAEAESSDSRQRILGIVQFAVYLITGIMFLRMLYLSSVNARSLGAQGMEFTPKWTVAWFFVPIASLWKPLKAVKELFMALHPQHGEDWRSASPPKILMIWWPLWLMANIAGQAAFRLSLRADTLEEIQRSSWVMFTSDCLDLPLGLVAIAMVSTLQQWQSEKQQLLAAVERERSDAGDESDASDDHQPAI